jgi:hypothetical protein
VGVVTVWLAHITANALLSSLKLYKSESRLSARGEPHAAVDRHDGALPYYLAHRKCSLHVSLQMFLFSINPSNSPWRAAPQLLTEMMCATMSNLVGL